MGIGYTRNDTPNNIANGNVIAAADLDGEFDAIVAAFNETTGHTHDGTADEGGAISVLGPVQEYLGDGSAFYPKTTAVYTLGKASNVWSNLYLTTLTLGGTAVTSTAAEINKLDGYTGTFSDLNKIAAVTATAAELNVLDGIAGTLTFTELNYVDGVTSAIQTQLNNKQPLSAVLTATTASFLLADETKLDAIEALADVTDTVNVTAAGALMDSELTNLAAVKAIDQSLVTTASPTFNQGNFTTVDTANLEVTTLKARDGVAAGGIASVTGVTTLNSAVLTTADINGGTVDNASIGATTRSTGLFTTLGTNGLATLASVNIDGGNIDATVIGAATPAAGDFTTIGTTGDITVGDRIRNTDGVEAGPSYTFDSVGNSDTGMFLPAANTVGFSTNGNLRLSVDTAAVTSTLPHLAANGTEAAAAYGFTGQPATGMYREAGTGNLNFSLGGTEQLSLEPSATRFVQNVVTPKVVLSDGSAAGPSFTYSGDTDTGLYSAGSNTLGVATAGAFIAKFSTNALHISDDVNLSTTPASTASETGIALNAVGLISASRSNGPSMDLNRDSVTGSLAVFKYNKATVGSISVTGSNATYNTTSDYRTKENITPVQGAVELIRALNPITYTATSDGQWYDGFLAHEVQGIIPTAVTGELDGTKEEEYEVTPADGDTPAVMGTRTVPDMQSMDYGKLTPILTAGLQAALDKIDALEARIAALEAGV
jgi:hypothetical protein